MDLTQCWLLVKKQFSQSDLRRTLNQTNTDPVVHNENENKSAIGA